MEIGKRILQIKERFSLSNEQMGEICDVSYTAIGNIINGITKDPGVSLFIKLSQKLDLNPEWVLFGKGAMTRAESAGSKKDHPETIKYLKQEIENLKLIIQSKESETETLKKMIRLMENQLSSKKQA